MRKIWICSFPEESSLRAADSATKAFLILLTYIKDFYESKTPISPIEAGIFNNLEEAAFRELSESFIENMENFGVLDLCNCESVEVES